MQELKEDNNNLMEKQKWYENEMERQSMEIMHLQQENKQLRQNEIDENKYELWTWKQVLKWMITVENGMFAQYEKSLAKNLEQGKVKGSDLKFVDRDDLKDWGVIVFGDMKALKRHIDRLCQQNDAQIFE